MEVSVCLIYVNLHDYLADIYIKAYDKGKTHEVKIKCEGNPVCIYL